MLHKVSPALGRERSASQGAFQGFSGSFLTLSAEFDWDQQLRD